MRFNEIVELFENARADLYHGTLLVYAEKIIAANTMHAKMPIRSKDIPAEVKGQTKTVSFSRSKAAAEDYSKNTMDHPGMVSTVLVFDQDRLKQMVGNRLRPYDDIPTPAYAASYAAANRGAAVPKRRYRKDAEEVVFGDIVGINKCIKKIIIIPTGSARDIRQNNAAILRSPLLKDPRTVIQYFDDDFNEQILSPQEYVDFISVPGNVRSD